MKFARATATPTTCDHRDRTTLSAEADANRDNVLEADGMPTFGLIEG